MINKVIIPNLFILLLLCASSCSDGTSSDPNSPKDGMKISSEVGQGTNVEEVITDAIKKLPCYFVDQFAKKRCDSAVARIFGAASFKKNIAWNEGRSYINCDSAEAVILQRFGDSSCCHPRTYTLSYELRVGGRSVYEFDMIAGPDQVFGTNGDHTLGQLEGYAKLLKGEFEIDHDEAERIARSNNFIGKKMTIELCKRAEVIRDKKSSFYWLADRHEEALDSCEVLEIDPISGSAEVKTMYFFTISCE